MVGVTNSMKAWEVTFNGYLDEEEHTDIVFADTFQDAKKEVIDGGTVFDNDAFTIAKDEGATHKDIELKRIPKLDNCEDLSEMMLVEKMITLCGWLWQLDGKSFNEDNFNKPEFEKTWKYTFNEIA